MFILLRGQRGILLPPTLLHLTCEFDKVQDPNSMDRCSVGYIAFPLPRIRTTGTNVSKRQDSVMQHALFLPHDTAVSNTGNKSLFPGLWESQWGSTSVRNWRGAGVICELA
jgi:hypothetical protein